MEENDPKKQIVNNLTIKSIIKQQVFDNTLDTLNIIKDTLRELGADFNTQLKQVDKRVFFEYKDRGKFEVQIKVASDVIIFSMHSNIFLFNRDHPIWNTAYAKENPQGIYTGIINVYNFLSDSFRYNRQDDLGYLIGRIFVNYENLFMAEGKRHLGYSYKNFEKGTVSKEKITAILQTIILYAIEFDLLVPPYDNVKIATVQQMNQKIETSRLQTGKRLGFTFNSDDVSAES